MNRVMWVLFPWLAIAIYAFGVLYIDSLELLPDPIASHWGPNGVADGFESVGTFVLFSSIGMGLVAAIWNLVVFNGKLHRGIRKLLALVTGAVFLFVLALFGCSVAFQVGLEDAVGSSWPAWLWFLWVPMLFALFWMLFSMPSIVVSRDLAIKLRSFTVLRLEFSDIASVVVTEARARDFGGLGLRFSKGRLAFIPSSGPAVLIKTKSNGTILVRSKNAEIAAAAISAKI